MSQDLVQYIVDQLNAGVTEGDILAVLNESDWDRQTISGAMQSARQVRSQTRPAESGSQVFDVRQAPTEHKNITGRITDAVTESLTEAPGILQSKSVSEVVGTTIAPDGKMSGGDNIVGGAQQAPKIQEGMSTKKKIAVFAILGFLILSIIGSIFFGFYRFFNSPERIERNVVEGLANLRAANYSLSIEIGDEEGAPPSISNIPFTSLTATGGITIDGEKFETVTRYNMRVDENEATKIFGERFDEGGYDAEVRIVDGKSYIQVKETWPIDITDSVQWGLVPEGKSIWSYPFFAKEEANQSGKELNSEDFANIQSTIRTHRFFTLDQFETTEEIKGKKTWKYKAELNKAGLKLLLQNTQPQLEKIGFNNDPLTELISATDSWGDTTGYVWISKEDYQLYRVEMKVERANGAPVNMYLELWNHNQPTQYTVPEKVVPLDEYTLLLNLQDVGFSDIVTTTKDTKMNPEELAREERWILVPGEKDTDGDGLSDLQEVGFRTDPHNRDTDGDGFDDRDEMINGYSPIDNRKVPIYSSTNDLKKEPAVRAMVDALDKYRVDNGECPKIPERWTGLIKSLNTNIEEKDFIDPQHPDRVYTYIRETNGESCYFAATFDTQYYTNFTFGDVDGNIGGTGFRQINSRDEKSTAPINCDDPVYCAVIK